MPSMLPSVSRTPGLRVEFLLLSRSIYFEYHLNLSSVPIIAFVR